MLALTYNGKTRKVILMKIFILCISIVFGIFAITVYAKGLRHRIKELTDKFGVKSIRLYYYIAYPSLTPKPNN